MLSMTETNEKFYQELDEHRAHASCCTCQTIVILFSLILVVALLIVFYLFWRFNQEKANIAKLPQKISSEILSNKFNINTTDLSQVEIPISDSDLTKILSSGFNLDNFLLQDIQAMINEKEIILFGQLLSPIKSKVVISAVPKVQDGKIRMEVKELKTGSLNWPEFLAKGLSNNISGFLNQKIWLIYQTINVDAVTLGDGKMVIKGKIK